MKSHSGFWWELKRIIGRARPARWKVYMASGSYLSSPCCLPSELLTDRSSMPQMSLASRAFPSCDSISPYRLPWPSKDGLIKPAKQLNILRSFLRRFSACFRSVHPVPIAGLNAVAMLTNVVHSLVHRPCRFFTPITISLHRQHHSMRARISLLQSLTRSAIPLRVASRRLPTYGLGLASGVALTWYLYEPQLSECDHIPLLCGRSSGTVIPRGTRAPDRTCG